MISVNSYEMLLFYSWNTHRQNPMGYNKRVFFQFKGKIKAITVDINKTRACLRLGQAYSNEERDKKMYIFCKKFIRLVGVYIDTTTLNAVVRIINRTVGKY